MSNHIPVLIVGAGPTGLTAALELSRQGVEYRIIDKLPHPVETSNALGIQARTLETWHQMGILEDALALGKQLKSVNMYANGKRVARFNLKGIESRFPYLLILPQSQTEELYIKKLAEHGKKIERLVKLTDIMQSEAQVTVTLQKPNNDTETLTADWVIACDGSNSRIRNQLKIPFIGKDLEDHFIMADTDVLITLPNGRGTLPNNQFHVFLSDDGVFAVIPINNNQARIIADVSNDTKLFEEVSPSLTDFKRLAKERIKYHLEFSNERWTSGFWVRERIAKQFIAGHVILAGDAAHVHSPAGARGMNTGIQDAANLGWKLALVVKGIANKKLLESYETERHPIAATIIQFSSRFFKVVTIRHPLLIWLRNQAMSLMSKLPYVNKKLARRISQTNTCYKKSTYVQDHITNKSICLSAGHYISDVRFFDATKNKHCSLFDSLKSKNHILLLFIKNTASLEQIHQVINKESFELYSSHIDIVAVVQSDKLNEDVVKLNNTVTVINDSKGNITRLYAPKAPAGYLIRPDKYIALTFDVTSPHILQTYLKVLFCHVE